MSKETMKMNMIGDLIFIALGLWFMIGWRYLGQRTSDFYFKWLKMRFSVRGYQFGFFFIGLCFLAFGLLSILGILSNG